MKRAGWFLAVGLLVGAGALAGTGAKDGDREVVYQASLFETLAAGGYDGMITVAELKSRGDVGIGTFDGLDGELVMDRGVVYQVKHGGETVVAGDSTRVPFAIATFLDPDLTLELAEIASFDQLTQTLEQRLESPNQMYAIRLEGDFDYVKTRSVPAQKKPYPPLDEAVKNQKTFEFQATRGTIIGFYFPAALKGVNLAGFHFHYLSSDGKAGGHLLELKLKSGRAVLDPAPTLRLDLPGP